MALSSTSDSNVPDVVVVGCGSIGLPLAVAFATRGLTVLGVDTDGQRLARLLDGDCGDGEADLASALKAARRAGRIDFAAAPPKADHRRTFILTVPTPIDGDGRLDRRPIDSAFETALACARAGDLIVVRSTVPIGRTRRLAALAEASGVPALIASCPDRSLSGRAFADQFAAPNVVGAMDSLAARAACRLFARLGPVSDVGSPEAAEAVKLFSNVQRDTVFALANQFALVCERLDLDFEAIRHAAAADYPRFLPTRPGPVGGPCLTKDVHLLAESDPGLTPLLGVSLTARAVNASLVDHVVAALAHQVFGRPGKRPVIAVLGLAFKGSDSVSDRRGSFGMALVERLRGDHANADIRAHDPGPGAAESAVLAMVDGADAVVFANDHPVFAALDLAAVAARLNPSGLIYDMCGRKGPAAPLPNGARFHGFGNRAFTPPGAS